MSWRCFILKFIIFTIVFPSSERPIAPTIFKCIILFWISPLNILINNLPILLHTKFYIIIHTRNNKLTAKQIALLLSTTKLLKTNCI